MSLVNLKLLHFKLGLKLNKIFEFEVNSINWLIADYTAYFLFFR